MTRGAVWRCLGATASILLNLEVVATVVLLPWTSYLILPLFALANAGIAVGGGTIRDALSSPVTAGVMVGLVLGKLLGVAGIGFTVSLFVAGLAFDDLSLEDEAKIGVLAASILAAIVGSIILQTTTAVGAASRKAGGETVA